MPFSYTDAVAALDDALRFGVHPSLDTITALCEALGRPQDAFRADPGGGYQRQDVGHLDDRGHTLPPAVLQAASYTSPHLQAYTERIRLGGADCPPDDFAAAVEAVLDWPP